MLTAHPEMHEKRDIVPLGGGGQYGTGGGGMVINEKCTADQPPPPPPPPQRDPSDPTISAKKLPKKRKFDPSELEEMDKTSNVTANVNNMIIRANNQPISYTSCHQSLSSSSSSSIHSNTMSLQHPQRQHSPIQQVPVQECFQV